ncbi:MAG: N-acetylmuramoyl-L-alanine amidase [Candidatus Acidiferrales bacterium]
MTHVCANKYRKPAEILLLAIGLIVSLAANAGADRQSDARDQFERAVTLRTTLESQPQNQRTAAAYLRTVSAYHRVYLITPQSEEATPALIAEAELYQAMGEQFDRKYFQSAINTYSFLIKQYPSSRYRGTAQFSVAKILDDDLRQTNAAEAAYKEYLKRFPRSDKSDDVREALKEIADARAKAEQEAAEAKAKAQQDANEAREKAAEEAAAAQAQKAAAEQPVDAAVSRSSNGRVQGGEEVDADARIPRVTGIHTMNGEDRTRIVLSLDGTVRYDSARLPSPERIYFDLHKAELTRELARKTIDVDNGLLKSVRLAQNKPSVVRLVLDASGARNYSALLLTNPYRLIIDVRTSVKTDSQPQPLAVAKKMPNEPPAPEKTVPSALAGEAAKRDEGLSPKSVESVVVTAKTPQPSKPIAKSRVAEARAKAKAKAATVAALRPPTFPKPTHDGQLPLTRELGLKINRIVIDAGHGGKDTGTIGPHGLMEKDLCLDVALRLGSLIQEKLPGTQVIYTRKDDTFVPLEQRTAIANEAKADLFISVHANSSHDHAARGIETYYLNFATSEESMEVAARENALAQESLHDLQDLIKKIARNDKIEESKELAGDIQDSLTHRMQLVSQNERNRGVKKAPFVVLIGANMPSVLSEISFLSNPYDERLLRKGDQRERIAEGLYRGIASYLDNLNSLSNSRSKLVSESENRVGTSVSASTVVASDGNPK